MEGGGSILEVTGLEKSYGRNKVLKGVDLTVRKGEVIAIIGPSGCGKSTFIRCLNLLEEPDCGKIIYKGTDLVSADKKTRSETLKDIGMVFQQFNLFPHKTVMDNVTMAPQLVSKMSKEDAEAKADPPFQNAAWCLRVAGTGSDVDHRSSAWCISWIFPGHGNYDSKCGVTDH